MRQLFIGPAIHTNAEGKLIIFEKAKITVEDGKIKSVNKNLEVQPDEAQVIELKDNQFLIPGFIDCHIHATQFPNLGIGYDEFLLEWLESYTFPLEIRFSDNLYAEKVMDAVVKRTLSMGTTTACYFASLYAEASLILAKAAAKLGQRAFIGKINMNKARADNYFESTEKSINDTIKFIDDVSNLKNPLVKPIITPRFALSCDMELMEKLAVVAKENDLCIQTHISENADEVKCVKEEFEGFESYAAIYDEAGLLTDKTILAHGIYLEDSDIEILKAKKSKIAHCPASNTYLKSGLCNVQKILEHGITVGLGTDVAGGASPCILDAMRTALQVSNHISFQKSYKPLNFKDVFHLATLGGAACLSIDDVTGNFEPGKQFDALIIDTSAPSGILDNLREYSLSEQLQRFIYSGDDRNIVEAYVAGRRVK